MEFFGQDTTGYTYSEKDWCAVSCECANAHDRLMWRQEPAHVRRRQVDRQCSDGLRYAIDARAQSCSAHMVRAVASKKLAEKAAWDFVEEHKCSFGLTA